MLGGHQLGHPLDASPRQLSPVPAAVDQDAHPRVAYGVLPGRVAHARRHPDGVLEPHEPAGATWGPPSGRTVATRHVAASRNARRRSSTSSVTSRPRGRRAVPGRGSASASSTSGSSASLASRDQLFASIIVDAGRRVAVTEIVEQLERLPERRAEAFEPGGHQDRGPRERRPDQQRPLHRVRPALERREPPRVRVGADQPEVGPAAISMRIRWYRVERRRQAVGREPGLEQELVREHGGEIAGEDRDRGPVRSGSGWPRRAAASVWLVCTAGRPRRAGVRPSRRRGSAPSCAAARATRPPGGSARHARPPAARNPQ